MGGMNNFKKQNNIQIMAFFSSNNLVVNQIYLRPAYILFQVPNEWHINSIKFIFFFLDVNDLKYIASVKEHIIIIIKGDNLEH